jgi:hypothetical protein
MVEELCGDSKTKWEEATKAAVDSLKIRSLLWDSVSKNKIV